MICLGIESSCDDTSLALVRDGKLLGQATSSQVDLHALFGGVVPEMASREHARFIGPLFDKLLADTGVAPGDISAVAVARGPGLLGSLLVGAAFAKSLALGLGARLIGVNHLHAHLFAAGLEQELVFPALGLLVSGGHTHLYRIEGPLAVATLGRTLDDAAGEAFDKAGKMLGLPYPAGRHIDTLANEGRAEEGMFPRPYLGNDNLDFSFSGLKTAMQSYLRAHPDVRAGWEAATGNIENLAPHIRSRLADVCASYRLSVVETLAAKTLSALGKQETRDIRSIFLAGGVAANSLLRKRMQGIAETHALRFIAPSPALCTDNGAMIAYLGSLLAGLGYEHGLDVEAVPRGRSIPDDMFVRG